MTSTVSRAAAKGLSENACLQCRRVKMKCRLEAPNTICERCTLKSLDCLFEKHRRGRKPTVRLNRSAPQNVVSPEEGVNFRQGEPHSSSGENLAASSQRESINHADGGFTSPPSPTQRFYPTRTFERLLWEASDSLQPSKLLSKKAQEGHFSLQNVLSIPNLLRSNSNSDNEDSSRLSPPSLTADDPICSNILSYPIALGLFESFMRSLNPYISQFDPLLHTFEYVQQKSSLLLSAILSASSKAFHPPLHAQLHSHTENLLAKAFVKGEKSVEIVQGILVLTYWKEPDETRTWLLIGYAIRMCLELEYHKLNEAESQQQSSSNELQGRERRNCQRTWLVLFVYDRSLSSQMGKPWMIEQDNLIRNCSTWHLHDLAVPGGDLLLAAFVQLRIMSSEMLDLVFLERPASSRSRPETLLKMLNSEISRWESDWYTLFDHKSVSPCQHFLVRFYGLHVRLLLNSCSLQDLLAQCKDGVSPSKQALWLCFTSAVGMLELISQEFGPLKLLYFAQDSVHVMTAYSATFLIKLLLSVPGFLRTELELLAINSIREATVTFKDQCAADKTGCAMQAQFLSKVVDNYHKMKTPSRPSHHGQDNNPRQVPAQTETEHRDLANTTFESTYPGNDIQGTTAHDAAAATTAEDCVHTDQDMGELGRYAFADNEVWEKMFADAGFRLNDGVLLP